MRAWRGSWPGWMEGAGFMGECTSPMRNLAMDGERFLTLSSRMSLIRTMPLRCVSTLSSALSITVATKRPMSCGLLSFGLLNRRRSQMIDRPISSTPPGLVTLPLAISTASCGGGLLSWSVSLRASSACSVSAPRAGSYFRPRKHISLVASGTAFSASGSSSLSSLSKAFSSDELAATVGGALSSSTSTRSVVIFVAASSLANLPTSAMALALGD